MRKFLFPSGALALVLLVAASLSAEPPKVAPKQIDDVPQYLQDTAVTIRSNAGEGSGTFKVTSDGQVWVWTCGHVVQANRKTRDVVDAKGGTRRVVEFDDLYVIRQDVEDGETTGDFRLKAEVIRYSDAEHGEDLALLRLRSKKFKPANSAIFWLDKDIPKLGTELYHCGSLLGQFGSNSLTRGVMSQYGRMLYGKPFDQVQCTSFPGSSGGMVVESKSGKYVGMVVRGAGEGFTLVVPVRRMHKWAKEVGIEFAIDDSIAVPTDEKLKAPGIERSGNTGAAGGHAHDEDAKAYPFQVKKLSKNCCDEGGDCQGSCGGCGCDGKKKSLLERLLK